MPVKSEGRRYAIGTTVMAKWPKTSFYYKGEIIDYNDIEYLVRFDDEENSELPLKFRDVTLPFDRSSRSRSRGRTPTRKSPARKSPSRKSPARKSPSRKSPARKSKSPGRKPPSSASSNKRSPGRKSAVKASPDTSVSPQKKTDDTHSSKPKESKVVKNTEVSPTVRSRGHIAATRQSARIANVEKDKTDKSSSNSIRVDLKAVTKTVYGRGSFKDYIVRAWKCCVATAKAVPITALMIFFPFLINQMCTKNKCSILDLPDIPRKLHYYYDQRAVTVTVGYIATLLLLAYVPVGRVVKCRNGANVRCNGFVSLLLCFGLIPALLKLEYNVVNLYPLYRHFLVSFTCLGLIISFLLYVKSFYARKEAINPKGKSGYFLPDFLEGREIYPRIGNIDFKFFLFRAALLLLVMINIIVVVKDLQTRLSGYSPTLLVACALQILYVVDIIWFEDNYFTTYEYLKQGTGLFISVGYLGMPFAITITTRYVFNHRTVELPWYFLVGIGGLNLFGYIILRGANSQKHAFRSNPTDPGLAHLESLPTSAGQRLLVSGWWGLVRHPNYLGDILVQLSWVLVCGFKHAIPWIIFGFSAAFLLIRIFIVESECKKKYGLAWTSYTVRVKHRLIPKVF